MGDFNIPDVDWITPSAHLERSKKIVDALQDASLRQMVKETTRKSSTLDLVLTDGDSVLNVCVS